MQGGKKALLCKKKEYSYGKKPGFLGEPDGSSSAKKKPGFPPYFGWKKPGFFNRASFS